jgi:group II intron reverse transcriptase/maturase
MKVRYASSPGIDGESAREARSTFDEWSGNLISEVHQKGYRPPEEKRPIGVPCIRDRALQRSVSKVLEQIYEQDFLPSSFGGRNNLSAHHAVSTLQYTISNKKISWVYEADLKNFFGSLDHRLLMQMVEHRVTDPRILTLLRRWLKSGVIEAGCLKKTEFGVPQGGSISVLLSNVYLHYVLDLWFEKVVKPRLKGEAYLCRYLDDFVICFQLKRDAKRVIRVIQKRLQKFSLSLEPSKTQLVPFGRFTKRDCDKLGRKPPTIDFLGFTLYGRHFVEGNYVVCLKTGKRSLSKTVANLKEIMRKGMHLDVKVQAKRINASLRGFYQYFGVPLNSRILRWLRYWALRYWKKVLSKRSQKGYLTWEKYNKTLKAYPLERPKHKYNYQSFKELVVL